MTGIARVAVAGLFAIACVLGSVACGGDDGGKDKDPTPTPTSAADDIGANLPTVTTAELEIEFVNEARNIQAFLEFAGGIRKACEKTPCTQSENPLVNWANAANRCAKLATYNAISTDGTPAARALYTGLTAACARITSTLKLVNTNTTPADHRRLAEESLAGLPGLIAATVQ